MIKFIRKYFQAIITLIIIVVVVLCYLAVSVVADVLDLHLYFGWKEIKVNDSFSVEVPNSWELGEENGLLYFYDTNIKSKENSNNLHKSSVMLFQSKLDDMFEIGEPLKADNDKTEKNILGDNFQSVVQLESEVNSLGTISGDSIISLDNVTYKKNYIIFNNDSNIVGMMK